MRDMALVVQERVVGDAPAAVPDSFVTLREPLAGGVPHAIALGDGIRLVIAVPTGVASTWRDADPATVVTDSARELAAAGATGPGAPPRAPARLIVEDAGVVVAVMALAAGAQRRVPLAGGGSVAALDLVVLDWDIRAGSLRGPGDEVSYVRFAWRRV